MEDIYVFHHICCVNKNGEYDGFNKETDEGKNDKSIIDHQATVYFEPNKYAGAQKGKSKACEDPEYSLNDVPQVSTC